MFDFYSRSYAIKLVFGLVVVIGVGAILLGLRRFGGDQQAMLRPAAASPRLAVIVAATVDGQRLVLIRRDNVEHLLIIGGPTDVVVEQNIVRATAAQPGRTARATAGGDRRCRAPVPLGEGTMWPLRRNPPQA